MTRQAVLAAAVPEIGPDTPEKRIKYWTSALGRAVTYEEIRKLAWCGGFALWALHEAGLGKDKLWKIGAGFLLQKPHPLPTIKRPEPGDIGYQDAPYQHHFIVEQVDGNLVHSIDGNQPDVRRKVRAIGAGLTFFSIAPLLTLAGKADDIPLPDPAAGLPRNVTTGETQHALNNLIMRHLANQPPALLTVDGISGPKTKATILWAQKMLGVPETGFADAVTCHALGLS